MNAQPYVGCLFLLFFLHISIYFLSLWCAREWRHFYVGGSPVTRVQKLMQHFQFGCSYQIFLRQQQQRQQ